LRLRVLIDEQIRPLAFPLRKPSVFGPPHEVVARSPDRDGPKPPTRSPASTMIRSVPRAGDDTHQWIA
jgi:hypothetical protein